MKRTLFSCCIWLTSLTLPLFAGGIVSADSCCDTTVHTAEDEGCVCPYAQAESYGGCHWYYNHCDPTAEVTEAEEAATSDVPTVAEVVEQPAPPAEVESAVEEHADYWYDSESGSYYDYDFTDEEVVAEETAEDALNDLFNFADLEDAEADTATETEEAASDIADSYADEYGDDYYSEYEDYNWDYEVDSYCPEDAVPATDTTQDVTAVNPGAEASDEADWADSIVEDPWHDEYDYAYDDYEDYEYQYGAEYDYDAEVMGETQWDAEPVDEPAVEPVAEDAWENDYYSDYGYDYEYWEEGAPEVQADETEDEVAATDSEEPIAVQRKAVLSLAHTLDRFGSALQNLSAQLTAMVTDEVAEGPAAESTQR